MRQQVCRFSIGTDMAEKYGWLNSVGFSGIWKTSNFPAMRNNMVMFVRDTCPITLWITASGKRWALLEERSTERNDSSSHLVNLARLLLSLRMLSPEPLSKSDSQICHPTPGQFLAMDTVVRSLLWKWPKLHPKVNGDDQPLEDLSEMNPLPWGSVDRFWPGDAREYRQQIW
jgi:hypothetical protein